MFFSEENINADLFDTKNVFNKSSSLEEGLLICH